MERNVIFVVLDSVRNDFFERFASRLHERADVAFARAHAPSGWSTPSHASIFTGEFSHEHGIHTYSRHFDTITRERVFHTTLPHATIAVTANVFVGAEFGFEQFFDRLIDIRPTHRYPSGIDPAAVEYEGWLPFGAYVEGTLRALHHDRTNESLKNGFAYLAETFGPRLPIPKPVDDSGRAVLRTARLLASDTPEPWFLSLNLMDAHIPLEPFYGLDHDLHTAGPRWSSDQYGVWELIRRERDDIADYWTTRESLYGAYIDYLDRIVAEFVGKLDEQTTRETTTVVAADHGENHGELAANGLANHKSSLAQPLLHVPLVVLNAPRGATAPGELASLLDMPELLKGLAHGEWHDIGRDVIGAEVMGMSNGPDPPREFDKEYYDRTIRASVRGETKVTWDSFGTVREHRLDPSRSNWQGEPTERDTIPSWAADRFSIPIDRARREARDSDDDHQVSAVADSRLRDLGYR